MRRILALIRQEEITPDISDAVLNRYKEAEHQCRALSVQPEGFRTGLALGNGQIHLQKYWKFVRDYLEPAEEKL